MKSEGAQWNAEGGGGGGSVAYRTPLIFFTPYQRVTKGIGDTVTPTMRRVRLMKYAYMNSNAMVRNRRKRLECHRSKKNLEKLLRFFIPTAFETFTARFVPWRNCSYLVA